MNSSICIQQLSEAEASAEIRRPLEFLVLDWQLTHAFAIGAATAMIILNTYAWIIVFLHRRVRLREEH
jgi:hypothetical protein